MFIAVTNESTRVTDEQVGVMVRAVAHQMRYHLCPAWERLLIPVVFYPKGAAVPPGADLIAVFDDADQAGALGYHDETPDGHQYGKVFAGTVLDNGGTPLAGELSVASVLSHEVMELAVDPTCRGWEDDGNVTLYAREVGDPVESGSYTCYVRGTGSGRVEQVTVSNFVLPAWFDPNAHPQSQYDWMGKLTAPFTMTAGGYVIVATEGGVTQRFGEEYPEWRKGMKEHPASRTARLLAQTVRTVPTPPEAATAPETGDQGVEAGESEPAPPEPIVGVPTPEPEQPNP